MFEGLLPVPTFEDLLLPQCTTDDWLTAVDLDNLDAPNNVKSLIAKMQEVQHIYLMGHTNVDGFMDTFLRILRFDDYPCCLNWFCEKYEDYSFYNPCGYSIIMIHGRHHKYLTVLDGSVIVDADYSNRWREERVLLTTAKTMREIWKKHKDTGSPIYTYVIRVVGTQFTFYKATAYKPYVPELEWMPPYSNWLTMQRHPPVVDSVHLNAYDVCNLEDRRAILTGMASIRKFLTDT
ncbi:hypothetical protein INT43_003048 [Umbelopsis isabellina]|uniref:Uncharacterized protein n=1 Tax=Mortierella isabellina TaxID=91625 RepID=A0A8H7U9Y9_MORIS|nr:hypothetical protein INT43_003048 [Umbelopsis isabellina]